MKGEYKTSQQKRDAQARYRDRHRDKIREKARLKREENREVYKAYHQNYYFTIEKNNPTTIERKNNTRRINKYGVTPEKYQEMLDEQSHVCAICGGTNPDGRQLFIDHCHKTNKVRGLLCTTCNSGIGYLDDSPEMLRRAWQYLCKHTEAEDA